MEGPQNARRHLSFLALSFAGIGALSLLGGLALAVFGLVGGAAVAFGGSVSGGAGLSSLLVFAGVALALSGVPELFAWVGLTRRRPWGRFLAIVLCTAGLSAFPFGTLFGAWGLWVLLSPGTLAEFGVARSWLSDGGAMLLGWFLRSDDRASSSSRRGRRRARRSGGAGCLLFVLLLAGFAMFVSCGELASSCAGRALGGSHGYEHMTPRARLEEMWRGAQTDGSAGGSDASSMSLDVPGASGGGAVGGNGGGSAGGNGGAIGDSGGGAVRGNGGTGGSSTQGGAGGAGSGTPAPVAPPSDSSRGRAVYVYTDADGTPVIVDDLEKVPASRKHTVRSP